MGEEDAVGALAAASYLLGDELQAYEAVERKNKNIRSWRKRYKV